MSFEFFSFYKIQIKKSRVRILLMMAILDGFLHVTVNRVNGSTFRSIRIAFHSNLMVLVFHTGYNKKIVYSSGKNFQFCH